MTKRDDLVNMLGEWVSLPDIMFATGWQAHTVRGAISTEAKRRGLKIERRRENGVTSYRMLPEKKNESASAEIRPVLPH